MLALDVPEEELVRRLVLRGADSGRPDDQNETIVRNRIAVYNKQTAVVADYYTAQNKFEKADGVGSVEDIFGRLSQVIDGYK